MRRPRLRRSLGQAMTELALVAPVLIVLLVGSGQVGAIAYGQITVDTATREGARIAAESPTNALVTNYTSGHTYTCTAADEVNVAIQSVCHSLGYLDTSKVSITLSRSIDTTSYLPPSDVELTASSNPCLNNEAYVHGVVNDIPSGQTATVASSAGGSKSSVTVSTSGSAYTLCLSATGSTQTVTATVGTGCSGYADSFSYNFKNNDDITQSFSLVSNGPCTTSTTTSTSSTSTSSSTSSTSSTSSSTSTPSAPPASTCSDPSGLTSEYFTITVSYPLSIFVPFVNRIFESSPGVRTVTSGLTARIEPCAITQGK